MSIIYLKGDATAPVGDDPKIIAHICNDIGGWGAGFVVAISKRWPRPEAMYRKWYHDREPVLDHEPGQIVMTSGRFALGETQVVMVQPGLGVVNMIAQAGTRTGSKGPPIRYEALDECLAKVNGFADSFKASVHAPRIGCGLAGATWDRVEPIIQRRLHVPVFVYDYGR